jgi:hypothetical protein
MEDSRIGMVARVIKLRDVPGLHAEEIPAIDKVHRILSLLETEEERLAAEQKRRALEEVLCQVGSIALKLRS